MSSASPFVMFCELSGEPLTTASLTGTNTIVVTPSGHVCRKRLLLTKLLENGGFDPFVADKGRPLQEDDLITLQQPSITSTAAATASNSMPPKSHPLGENNASSAASASSLLSFSSTLSRLQSEYDAVLLELFDTRQALTETRRELSQALYQNDAAVRVVARVTAERDAARQAQITGQQQQQTEQEQEQVVTKKRKIETTTTATATAAAAPTAGTTTGDEVLRNDISPADMESMQVAWEGLHKNRKSLQKQAASQAPSKTDLADAFRATALSAPATGGIVAMAAAATATTAIDLGRLIVTMNDKNQVHLYNVANQKVVAELETGSSSGSRRSSSSSASRPTAMDHYVDSESSSDASSSSKICLAFSNGTVQVFMIPNDSSDKKKSAAFATCEITSNKNNNTATADAGQKKKVVDVRFHPDGQHIVAALECGMVALLRYSSSNTALVVVSMFDSKNYINKNDDNNADITCGCLHPDGLIYLVGCATGEIYLWDFRSKTLLAKPLVIDEQEDGNKNPVTSVQQVIMSPNGYHIAALHDNGIVRIWDLRKQSCLATLNASSQEEGWLPACCVTFDVSGKYVAYGVSSGGSSSGKGKKATKDSAAAVHVVAVKEWNQIAASWKLDNKNDNVKLASPMTGLIWTSPEWLATCSSSSRGNNLVLIGKNNDNDEAMKE